MTHREAAELLARRVPRWRTWSSGGSDPDQAAHDAAVPLFDTEDARNAIDSLVTSGPRTATFAGR